jgi:hypothetical protein
MQSVCLQREREDRAVTLLGKLTEPFTALSFRDITGQPDFQFCLPWNCWDEGDSAYYIRSQRQRRGYNPSRPVLILPRLFLCEEPEYAERRAAVVNTSESSANCKICSSAGEYGQIL